MRKDNLDNATVRGFGDEWARMDQAALTATDRRKMFKDYFGILPKECLGYENVGADFGVGSGRWAREVSPLVKHLYCIDPSEKALSVAKRNLRDRNNCTFINSTIEECGLKEQSLDFAYCLGVLHHIPDPAAALHACIEYIKPGSPLLIYIYYRFDNKPWWFRLVWRVSDVIRGAISKLPYNLRYWVSQTTAILLYWPLARTAKVAEEIGLPVDNIPLSYYRDKSFYTMRTDALDRFGTRLEHRFTKEEIQNMMLSAGLESIRFSDRRPYWCAVGYKHQSGH